MRNLRALVVVAVAAASSSDNDLGIIVYGQGFWYPVTVAPIVDFNDPDLFSVDFIIDGNPRSIRFNLGVGVQSSDCAARVSGFIRHTALVVCCIPMNPCVDLCDK